MRSNLTGPIPRARSRASLDAHLGDHRARFGVETRISAISAPGSAPRRASRRAARPDRRRAHVLDEHAAIVDGLTAHDPRHALLALERHLVSTASVLGVELAGRVPHEISP